MKMSVARLVLMMLLAANVFGIETGEAYVEGKIKSFTKNEVILETETTLISVPRNLVYEKSLVSGKNIRIPFLSKEESKIKITQKKK